MARLNSSCGLLAKAPEALSGALVLWARSRHEQHLSLITSSEIFKRGRWDQVKKSQKFPRTNKSRSF